MSQNDPQSQQVKIVLPRETYECFAGRRARQRAEMGLPAEDPDNPYVCEDDVIAQQAEAKKRANRDAAAKLAPAPPTRGPLCRAAKAKVAERNASIPGFERHSRKCQICRSPYVDLIEQAYLQWECVDSIRGYFQLADADTVYRHARAAGLDVLRRQNSRWVVEQFIEQWRSVKISSSTVIRSIRALSCLDDKGRWTDLPRTHVFVRANDSSTPPPDAAISSTGEPIAATTASDTGIPEAGSDDVSFSSERSSRAQVGVPSSFERSESP